MVINNIMTQWICYILKSVDSNKTYVGATDNLYRRLCDHNGIHGISKGAKATKGNQWIPILFISGFPNKIACLSFESGVRRVVRRKNKKYNLTGSTMNKRIICVYNLLYLGSPINKWSRNGLKINWLETNYYNTKLILPNLVTEYLGITNIDKSSIG